MKTLLVRGDDDPPRELREIIEGGSTEVEEMPRAPGAPGAAERIVIWNSGTVIVDDRRLRWPDDVDELKMLLQTGG